MGNIDLFILAYSIKEYSDMVVAGGVIIGLLGGLMGWLTAMYRKISKVSQVFMSIQKEFYTNGGSSLRDSVNRIEENQKTLLSLQHHIYTYWDNVVTTPIIIRDSFGSCLWVNKAFLDLTGRSMDEILDYNWEIVVHQDDRERVREELYNACGSGQSFEFDYRVVDKNDNVYKVTCKSYGNHSYGYIGFLLNISQGSENSLDFSEK